ncbi:hypothetical protein [Acidimangrovimonas sediminis]|uniref:hypothetical protein n=1 Tax=Acidimangrovimonas sediminis TaxID=2056283 RepID=UPI000C80CEBD|nr:hypothetical protein [Acidimangrovimonas sediminis]
MQEMTIDLNAVTGTKHIRNLSGKERGIAARQHFCLDSIDGQPGTVEVRIPEYVDTISPSFFQGLFSQSIAALHGKDAFLKKYHFIVNEQQKRWVDVGIRNATSSRQSLV